MKPTNRQAYARMLVLKHVVVHALSNPGSLADPVSRNWPEEDRRDYQQKFGQLSLSLIQGLKRTGLWRHTSPQERLFLRSFGLNMNHDAHMAAGWRMECVAMFLWAFGMLPEFPRIDEEMDTELLKGIPVKRIGLFTTVPPLRRFAELDKKRELLELWHWRVRTRWLIEEGHPLNPTSAMQQEGLYTYDDIIRASADAAHSRGDLFELLNGDFVFRNISFRDLPEDDYSVATSIITERHFALNWLCGFAPGNRWDDTPTGT